MEKIKPTLPSHFKIKVYSLEEAQKIILILNTHGINEGLARNLKVITRLVYPKIFYIKDYFISQSDIYVEYQHESKYGPELNLNKILDF